MRNYPVVVLSTPGNASVNGSAVFIGQAAQASFVLNTADSTLAGTYQVQGSNDIPVGDPTKFTPTFWNNITNGSITITAGVASALIVPAIPFQYIRIVFTRSGGAVTAFSINMTALGV